MKATIRYIEASRDFTKVELRTESGGLTLEGESDFVLAIFYEVSNGNTLRPILQTAIEAENPNNVTSLAEVERRYILSTLQQFGGNKVRTAAALGIDRTRLYRLLKAYDKLTPQ